LEGFHHIFNGESRWPDFLFLLCFILQPMADCKVLIIDDDEDDVGILAEALTKCGVDGVHYVFSAMQAFMYLEEVAPECLPKLIITDLYLPGMTGAEFLIDLKNMDKYKDIHVIVLSTFKSPKELEKYRQMGAADYLEKPSTYQEYLSVAAEMKKRIEA
jgi:CheY-like chemotaxis protein